MSGIEGVSFQARLPLAWRAAEALSEETVHAWMHTNAVLLRALATMEVPQLERDSEPGAENEKRLERLEAKLDLALDLLARLLARDAARPQRYPATLSATAIEWLCNDAPPSGNLVISLYLDPRLPQPLQLPAEVMASSLTPDGRRTLAEFRQLDEETQEWLERLVFRQHRRHIQASRGHQVG